MDTIFIVKPTIGVKIINILEENPLFTILLNKEWRTGCIKMLDITQWKDYQIRYLEHNNEYYLTPIQKYQCKKFEELFGLGGNGDGYNSNSIIRIRNAMIERL